MNRLIVAGTPKREAYRPQVLSFLDRLRPALGVDVLVIPAGVPVGRWAAAWAEPKRLPVLVYKLGPHGNASETIRNNDMVTAADSALIFWNGAHEPTEDLINKSLNLRLDTLVIYHG